MRRAVRPHQTYQSWAFHGNCHSKGPENYLVYCCFLSSENTHFMKKYYLCIERERKTQIFTVRICALKGVKLLPTKKDNLLAIYFKPSLTRDRTQKKIWTFLLPFKYLKQSLLRFRVHLYTKLCVKYIFFSC